MSFSLNSEIQISHCGEYRCLTHLNIYDSPNCNQLATQAAVGRHLRLSSNDQNDKTLETLDGNFIQTLHGDIVEILHGDIVETLHATSLQVCLCEDDYPGWLSHSDLSLLQPSTVPYQAKSFSTSEIEKLLPHVIAFTHSAREQPNHYLWGGTVGPDYDCSGLMQAAFASVGIWLPRDAYQQEGFTLPIAMTELQPGDLIFFGNYQKATHVGLYLGDGCYIHSSGKTQGRDGIGIDQLSEQGDDVSLSYYQQLRGAGRVVKSYQPRRREGHEGI
jgi:cell wall-associated NlpC family hydrolase